MPTVLLAETDRDLRETYHQYLARHGFQVETAETGLDCLTMLRHFVPDLLVLDLELPWGGGDGVVGVMREHSRLSSVPILLTSAAASPQKLDGFVSPPVVTAIAKPFPLAALLEQGSLLASPHWETPSSDSDRLEVLVVDDEPVVRDVLGKYLERQGFRVWTADNGEQALDLVADHGERIAIVLLDVQMPGLDGPQTLEGIREFNPQMPVCFMAGDPGHYESDDLVRHGARHVFSKPFRMDEMMRIVRRLVSETMEQRLEN